MSLDFTLSKDQLSADIVTFKDPKTNLEAVFRDVIRGAKFSSQTHPGIRVLKLKQPGQPAVRINLHERIGAATIILTDEWRKKLSAHPRVLNIVRSRKRRTPDLGRSSVSPTPKTTDGKPPSWALKEIGILSNTEWTGKGVKVAVLDSGIDVNHPDFKARINNEIQGMSFVAGQDFDDKNGHGTACAGIIAGPLNTQGAYRYGVAPDVELLIANIMGGQGDSWDDNILQALDWAKGEGAQVISMSFGAKRKVNEPYNDAYEDIAYVLRESGTFLTAAGGNFSNRVFNMTEPVIDPAAAPSIFASTATDANNVVWDGSCMTKGAWGEIEISAPGVNVYTAWAGPKNFTDEYSGTSFAAPHIAGIAALFIEKFPGITVDALEHSLVTNAKNIVGDPNVYGAGLVQAP